MSRLIARLRREERGATLIIVAIALPAFIAFGAFAVDLGNWWVHKRHLQTQADAAALAGAMSLQYPGCDDNDVAKTVIAYAGGKELQGGDAAKIEAPDTYWPAPTAAWQAFAPTHNPQVGDHANADIATTGDNKSIVRVGINRPNFFGDDPSKTAGRSTYADDDLGDGSSWLTSNMPCAKEFVDVKVTEARDKSSNPLHFLTGWWTPKFSDAHARVNLKPISQLGGLLPIGVEDVSPKRAHAYFYDETTTPPTLVGDAELYAHSALNYAGLAVWDNSVANGKSSGPASVTVNSARVGVVIALSGSSTSVTCGDQLVVCYGSSSTGLSRIRGYDTSGTGVRLQEVNLRPTCAAPDGAYFGTNCTADRVIADLPGLSTDENGLGVSVSASTAASGNKPTLLHWCTSISRWASVQNAAGCPTAADVDGTGSWNTVPITKGGGAQVVSITWKQTKDGNGLTGCSNSKPCTGTFDTAHRVFSGTSDSTSAGPIRQLELSDPATGKSGYNNVVKSATAKSFLVQIALAGKQGLAPKTDPPIGLRVFKADNTNPGQKHTLDCDPNLNHLEEEIAIGCGPQYTFNKTRPCLSTGADVNDLWNSPQPWECVALNTGTNENAPASGLNARVLCFPANSAGNCHDKTGNPDNVNLPYNPVNCTNPNRWPAFRDNGTPIPLDDPRRVDVFLVPFGTFDTGGSGTVPVLDFAQFYVTGWHGKGQDQNPCDGAGDEFAASVANNDTSTISGHYIKPVVPNTTPPGPGTCDPQALTPCLAVMTK